MRLQHAQFFCHALIYSIFSLVSECFSLCVSWSETCWCVFSLRAQQLVGRGESLVSPMGGNQRKGRDADKGGCRTTLPACQQTHTVPYIARPRVWICVCVGSMGQKLSMVSLASVPQALSHEVDTMLTGNWMSAAFSWFKGLGCLPAQPVISWLMALEMRQQ